MARDRGDLNREDFDRYKADVKKEGKAFFPHAILADTVMSLVVVTVIVAVAVNVAKQPLFSSEERVALIRETVDDKRVEVKSFDGLLVDFARASGATVIVRGLRAVSDFDYEFQMALMNRQLHPTLETVFLVPAVDLTYLSSSLVREVARYGGNVGDLVHPAVAEALRRRRGP